VHDGNVQFCGVSAGTGVDLCPIEKQMWRQPAWRLRLQHVTASYFSIKHPTYWARRVVMDKLQR